MRPKTLRVRLTSSLCPRPTDLPYFRDRMKTKINRKIGTSWSVQIFTWQLTNPYILPNSTNIPSGKDRADSSCREQLNGKSLQTPPSTMRRVQSRPRHLQRPYWRLRGLQGQAEPDVLRWQEPNISVSGITIDDLLHWLKHILRNKDVRRVVFHVGVNTCKKAQPSLRPHGGNSCATFVTFSHKRI